MNRVSVSGGSLGSGGAVSLDYFVSTLPPL